jgi:uncharacterized protein
LEIRQLFLDDFPFEPEFVDSVLADIDLSDVLVSYNGRSFDEPLLKTRCIMTGNRFPALRHADLVYPARRVYRAHLPDCALGTLELEILGVERAVDIPSSEIPEEWLRYLRTGEPGRLHETVAHNAEDIRSLAKLLGSLSATFANPVRLAKPSLLLSRTLFSMGRPAESLSMLEELASSGDERAAAFALKARHAIKR